MNHFVFLLYLQWRFMNLSKMDYRVNFFSENDLSIPYYYDRAEELISKFSFGWICNEINDIIELYNVWLFADKGIYNFNRCVVQQDVILKLKHFIIRHFNNLNSPSWIKIYKQIDFSYIHCFWEIIDRFNINFDINSNDLRVALAGYSGGLLYILQHERLVKRYNQVLTELLIENKNTAEWIIGEYLKNNISHIQDHLYFPKSLTSNNIEKIISDYLDSDNANLNYVRLISEAKKDKRLRLPDDIILKSKRVEQKLNKELLSDGNAIPLIYRVQFTDDPNAPLKWSEYDGKFTQILHYSKPKLLLFKGSDLLHYCENVFEFMTGTGVIRLISKISESDVLERCIGISGKYSYTTNMHFHSNEFFSLLQIESLYNILLLNGTNLEEDIKDFYERHLKEKYGYPSTKMSLPNYNIDWIAKCRIIAPELEAIAKRYHQYATRGSVDEDLLCISSDSIRITNASSANKIRYYSIKGEPQELYRLFNLLFSDQSILLMGGTFKGNDYSTFYDMLIEQNGQIIYKEYKDYQCNSLNFLISKELISVNPEGFIFTNKQEEMALLKHLYDFHCYPFSPGQDNLNGFINKMLQDEWLELDNHLLSPEERNYFDYYLYNTLYTNGPALRNRYAHGTNLSTKDENTSKRDYFMMLILLILALLKIEKDLILLRDSKSN